MNTINCRIKVNEHHDIAGVNITPAEAVVLRVIHDPNAANFSKSAGPDEKKNFWKFIINPRPAGPALTVIPAETEKGKPVSRPRTDQEEVARLRQKYLMRAKSGAQGSHIMDDVFPGESPKLPETFTEIGMEVPEPEAKKSKKADGNQPE